MSYVGGAVLWGLWLLVAVMLTALGVSVAEALYGSALGVVVVGYGVMEWRLRYK